MDIKSAIKFFDGSYLVSWGAANDSGITYYGFIIAVAILLGAVFGYLLAKKRGYPKDTALDMVLWCVPLAIVGARLYYVVFDAIGGNAVTFAGFFRIWEGGLAIYGAVLFAILGCWLLSIYYKKRKKPDAGAANAGIGELEVKIAGLQAEIGGLGAGGNVSTETEQKIKALKAKKKKLAGEREALISGLITKPTFFQMADLGAPFLILGQALGRIGCYYSGCCYGNPVTDPAWQKFPFAVQIGGSWHLATFFIESAWCFLGLALLLYFSWKKKRPFDSFVFAFYLMFYGLGRFILEFLRFDSPDTLWLWPGVIPASMAVAVIMFLWGGYLMGRQIYKRHKEKNRKILTEGI